VSEMPNAASWQGHSTLRRYVLTALVACVVAACSSENRGITEPTSAATPAEVFIHNTLHRADDGSSLELASSDFSSTYIPMISTLRPWAWDDFTSPVDTTIRTVSWQGGYCRSRLGLLPEAAKSFRVFVSSDNNGRPLFADGGQAVEVREGFAFDGTWSGYDCAYTTPLFCQHLFS
jgi:hypothetical protein